jgi:excisionase family DNA binding protein
MPRKNTPQGAPLLQAPSVALTQKPMHFLTPQELADYLKISKWTVMRLANKGKLPFRRVGGQIRFVEEEVLAVINATK